MGTGTRVAAATALGYVLGRSKKLKLAIAVGGALAGKRLAGDTRGLLQRASDGIDANERLSGLSSEARKQLVEAGRSAAMSVATHRVDAISDALRERADRWSGDESEPTGSSDECESTGTKAASKTSSSASKTASKTSSSAKKAASKASSSAKKSASKAPSSAKKSAPKKSSSAKKSASKNR